MRLPPFPIFALIAGAMLPAAVASSHREAPGITEQPHADSADVYAFVDPTNPAKLVLAMTLDPLREPAGDPSFHPGPNRTRYELHVDADGDAASDLTFTFRFSTQFSPHLVQTDDGSSTVSPLLYDHPGPIAGLLDPALGVFEPYTLAVTTGAGTFAAVNTTLGSSAFFKPLDPVGDGVIPDYDAYADQHVFDYDVGGVSDLAGRVFVGGREDGFYVDLRSLFDLAGFPNLPTSASREAHGVLAFVLEVPIGVVTEGGAHPVVGVWATTSVPETRVLNPSPTHPGDVVLPPSPSDPYVQVSRLGMPLVNMLLIGVNNKDRFNALHPSTDLVEFERFFTHPALAALMGFPSSNRADLVELFLTGLAGVNQTGAFGDMLRLDTTVPPTPFELQDPLGLFASPPDPAGFPNGRRIADDVVDVTLRALQGQLLGGPGPFDANDGVRRHATDYRQTFPFLDAPRSRSTEPVCVTLTSSTQADRAGFMAVDDAYHDRARPGRVVARVPAEPLVHFLLRSGGSSGAPTIETIELAGSELEVVVGPPAPLP